MLKNIFGATPECWNDHLMGYDRLRYITNAFMRMRFCDAQGCLELNKKGLINDAPQNYRAWFDWPTKIKCKIIFGHWAALKGVTNKPNIIALDTGCVWGNALTAMRVEDGALFQVAASL